MCSTSNPRKNSQSELKENIACKDDILKEYKVIRHEYNNMLQNIICFIEEEDWSGLKNYKGKLLEKTQVLNGNNLTQLVKIKNKKILSLVYKTLINCKENGFPLYLTIYNDIDDTDCYKIQCYKTLEEHINNAYEVATEIGGTISLKISGNTDGIRFAFENICIIKSPNNILKLINTKRKLKNKNIFINTFFETDKLTQEILISPS